jgi:hypothetical protein
MLDMKLNTRVVINKGERSETRGTYIGTAAIVVNNNIRNLAVVGLDWNYAGYVNSTDSNANPFVSNVIVDYEYLTEE